MSDDLHGNAPDAHPVALLIVDVINPCDFPEADDFLRQALPAARNIAALKGRAIAAGVPVVYANDNFGRWRSDLAAVVERCLAPGCKGRPLCEALRPVATDYFVLKPKHSAFYSTTLDLLLRAFRTEALVVCGFAANICVLFTANDAYLRDLRLLVPADCVASNTREETEAALAQMAKVLKADVGPSEDIEFTGPTRGHSPAGQSEQK
jgi:nicotinamidase-related amidase